jgi:hypothetical protein
MNQRKAMLIGAVAASASLVLSGCGALGLFPLGQNQSPITGSSATPTSTPTPAALNITGSLTVTLDDHWEVDEYNSCVMSPGYSDIEYGSQVTVTDDAGKVVGLGSVVDAFMSSGTEYANKRRFTLVGTRVEDPTSSIYGIEVAHRGVVRFPRSSLSTPIELTLGS